MQRKSIILMLLILGLLFSSNAYAQGWNGINPLKSTRGDVEKILGKCLDENSASCLYKLENQNVFIIYNTLESCANGIINVSKGTVLSISIFLQKEMSLNDLNINLKHFVVEEDPEIVGVFQYINENEGVTIEVKRNFIIGIYYGPSKKNVEMYKCKQKAK